MKSFLATIFFGLAFFIAYQFAGKAIVSEIPLQASLLDFFSSIFGQEEIQPEVLAPEPAFDPVPAPVFINEKTEASISAPVVEVAAPIANIDLRRMVLDILNKELADVRPSSSAGGERGPAGPPGPRGPAGPAGPSGASADTSAFVSRDFLTAQVNRIFDSIGEDDRISTLETSLGDQVTTDILSLTGSTSGEITIQPAAAAGTYTLTMPTDRRFRRNADHRRLGSFVLDLSGFFAVDDYRFGYLLHDRQRRHWGHDAGCEARCGVH